MNASPVIKNYRHRFGLPNRCVLLLMLCLGWTQPAQAQQSHAVILVYHHVGDSTPASTSVTPKQFAAHLDYLQQHHFNILPVDVVARAIAEKKPLPAKSVAITFDDGYRSVYLNALPLLKQRGLPFAVFVNPEAIDGHYAAYMSWSQLRQIKRSGALILNHSMHHRHLLRRHQAESRNAWLQRVAADIGQAQKRIEAETGSAPKLFAWPYGEFSRDLQQQLRGMGYIGFGQQSGPAGFDSNLAALPRFPLIGHYAEPALFSRRVNTYPLPVAVAGEDNSLLSAAELQPRLRLRLTSNDVDAKQLQCFFAGKSIAIDWLDDSQREFTIGGDVSLPAGRSKYTCTAPVKAHPGVYGWYSHLWIRPRADGSWPRE